MRFAAGVLRHDREDNLSRGKICKTFLAGNEFCLGRKDGRYPNQVLGCDAGVPQSQLERGQAFFVFPDAFGEKQTFRDHAFGQFKILLLEENTCRFVLAPFRNYHMETCSVGPGSGVLSPGVQVGELTAGSVAFTSITE